MATIDFYFDFRSPYSYLALTQLRQLDVAVSYHPFDIRELMEKVGNVPTSIVCKPKNSYLSQDLARWVNHYDVPFNRHPSFDQIDFRRLMRAILVPNLYGLQGTGVSNLFNAVWGSPQPLSTPQEVAQVMYPKDVDLDALQSQLDDPAWNKALDKSTADAVEKGVFGAPTMFVGAAMFFGNDRMTFVQSELENKK